MVIKVQRLGDNKLTNSLLLGWLITLLLIESEIAPSRNWNGELKMNQLKEIRCSNCNRKLGEGSYKELKIKCPKCKTQNAFKQSTESAIYLESQRAP